MPYRYTIAIVMFFALHIYSFGQLTFDWENTSQLGVYGQEKGKVTDVVDGKFSLVSKITRYKAGDQYNVHRGNHIYIASLNDDGSGNWADTIIAQNDTMNINPRKIMIDEDGNTYLLLKYSSDWGLNNQFADSSVITKYDTLGNIVFRNVLNESVNDFDLDAAGNVYLISNMRVNGSFAVQDLFLIKYSSNGTSAWAKVINYSVSSPATNSPEIGEAIKVIGNQVYFAGRSAEKPFFVGALDLAGNLLWEADENDQFAVDFNLDDHLGQSMIINQKSANGNLLIAGTKLIDYPDPNLVGATIRLTNLVVREYDLSGTKISEYTIENSTENLELQDFKSIYNGQTIYLLWNVGYSLRLTKIERTLGVVWEKEIDNLNSLMQNYPVSYSIQGEFTDGIELLSDGSILIGNLTADSLIILGDTMTSGFPACLGVFQCVEIPLVYPEIHKLNEDGITLSKEAIKQDRMGAFLGFGSATDSTTLVLTSFADTIPPLGPVDSIPNNLSIGLIKEDTSGPSMRSGVFTIGYAPGDDFASISDAVNALDGAKQIDGIVFEIRDGVYPDSIVIDTTINIDRENPDAPIVFMAKDPDLQNVLIKAGSKVVEIDGHDNIHFLGLKFETSNSSAPAVEVKNQTGLNWNSNSIVGPGTGIAIKTENSSGFHSEYSKIQDFANGVSLDGGTDFEFDSDTIIVTDTGIVANGITDLYITLAGISASTSGVSKTGFSIINTDGEITIENSQIEGKTLLQEGAGTLSISQNELSVTNGYAIESKANTGTVNIYRNKLSSTAGSAVEINCSSGGPCSNSTFTNSGVKTISVTENEIEVNGEGILVHDIPKTELIILRNSITNCSEALVASGISDNTNSILVSNNLFYGEDRVVDFTDVEASSIFKSNTVVSTSTGGSGETMFFNNVSTLTLCGNIGVHENGGEVVTFDPKVPTNFTVSDNGWWSSGGGNVSNDETALIDASSFKMDPKFVGGGDYSLRVASPYLEILKGCFDSLSIVDIFGNPRFEQQDLGAIERLKSGYDGKEVSFVLDDDYFFTAGGSTFNEFEIQGLSNFSSVNLTIKDKGGNTVYTSSSKTTFWDGTDVGSGSFVQEGAYFYELTLDSDTVGGFIYVKR